MRTRRKWSALVTVLLAAGLVVMAPRPGNAFVPQRGNTFVPGRTAVMIADSSGSGEGLSPYVSGTDVPGINLCHRSNQAYGALLDQWNLIDLTPAGFVACSGATPASAAKDGQYNERAQINAITNDTRLVIMQVGANPAFGQGATLCILGDCGTDPRMQQVFAYLQGVLPGELNRLYDAVQARLTPGGKVHVVLYLNPFPEPGRPVGPNCPYMNTTEIATAKSFVDTLNNAIRTAAKAHGFATVDASRLVAGRDVCGDPNASAFFPADPAVPQAAWLHPNHLGHRLQAARLGLQILIGV